MPEALNRARRYLLGQSNEAEAAAVEEQYFLGDVAAAEVEAEEDSLIEDYLDGRLDHDERARFESHYLTSPVHRQRVAVVRRLRAATPRQSFSYWWLSAAAAVIVATTVGVLYRPGQARPPSSASPQAPQAAPAVAPPAAAARPAPPTVMAFALSPINVRSGGAAPALVLPSGTDVVALELLRDGTNASPTDGAAAITTVEGREVWRGNATLTGLRPDVLARIEVPASALRPDDYVVQVATLRYYLRVRAR